MKSYLLSLLLILCFGLSTQALDQLDQTSTIVQDLSTHFEIGFISPGQELLPKVSSHSGWLNSFHRSTISGVFQALIKLTGFPLTSQRSFNFISSGASLIYDLSRRPA